MENYAQVEELARHLEVLSHPARLDIVFILAEFGEMTVGELKNAAELSAPLLSYHLKTLVGTEIITVRRQGREKHISLKRKGLPEVLRALALQ